MQPTYIEGYVPFRNFVLWCDIWLSYHVLSSVD